MNSDIGCILFSALGGAGATTLIYIFSDTIAGYLNLGLRPKDNYTTSEIDLQTAKNQIVAYQNNILNTTNQIIDNTTHGRSYKYDDFLAYLGKIALVAKNAGKSTDKLLINTYFALDNNNKINVVFVPGMLDNNNNVFDFIALDSNGNSITTNTTTISQNNKVELLDRGGIIPPPSPAASILNIT